MSDARRHSRPTECICGRSFAKYAGLSVHMRSCVVERHRSSAFVDGYAGEHGRAAEREWVRAGMPPVLPASEDDAQRLRDAAQKGSS